MFSLLITLISIALVAALAIVTIYYGGKLYAQSQTKAHAAAVINQGHQLLGASVLFYTHHQRWPASPDELVEYKYLQTLPQPSSQIAVAEQERTPKLASISSAYAQTNPEINWAQVKSGAPAFWLLRTVSEEVCRAVNSEARGDDGIYNAAIPGIVAQCFGTAANYTVLVYNTAEKAADIEAHVPAEGGEPTLQVDPIGGGWAKPPTKSVGTPPTETEEPRPPTAWTTTTLPNAGQWTGADYGHGRFIATFYGDNEVATSPDGITWTKEFAGYTPFVGGVVNSQVPTKWSGIAFGNGIFAATSFSNHAGARSTTNWTGKEVPGKCCSLGLTFDSTAGIFAAVETPGSEAYYVSTNGLDWSRRTVPPFPGQKMYKEVHVGDGVTLVNNVDGQYYAVSSPARPTWLVTRWPTSVSAIADVAIGNGLIVGVGSGGAVLASSDQGTTWTKGTMPKPTAYYSMIKYGGGYFLAIVSVNSDEAAYSTDGINWTATKLPVAQDWREIGYGNGKFIVLPISSATAAISQPPQ